MHPGVTVGEVARRNTTSAESGRYVREGKSVQAGGSVCDVTEATQSNCGAIPRLARPSTSRRSHTSHFASTFTATWHVFKRGKAGLWLRLMSRLCLSGSLTACALLSVIISAACPGIDTLQTVEPTHLCSSQNGAQGTCNLVRL
jgi:hypothetical protein